MAKIGFALTSSFCTVDKILIQMELLRNEGHEVFPITNPKLINWNTRFGKGEDIKKKIEAIAGNKITCTIIGVERFGPKKPLDAIIVAPATGNFIGKLANGITDNPVSMATKATLRNGSPAIIGIATNDGLGLNGQNVMKLLNSKNIYFIPFGQDNYESKPNSLVAHYNLLIPTLDEALNKKQFQPVLKEYKKIP